MSADQLVDSIAEIFATRSLTLSCAESCTGGLLSATITKKSGISKLFVGSIVSYANSVKQNMIAVPQHQLETYGAVSRPVAISMAQGIRKATKSDWAISTTGIAGPNGGTPSKPVGTVFFSVVGPAFEESYHQEFQGTREEVQEQAVEYALKILLEAVS